ncbi:hypothetical protein PUR61_02625 [Streptomyces sp. BE20]|nr:hypothetical protein [Streptomyces sp. BE20]MEE1821101.1 hypothetical protein [Streptomyces sp. BE20]
MSGGLLVAVPGVLALLWQGAASGLTVWAVSVLANRSHIVYQRRRR